VTPANQSGNSWISGLCREDIISTGDIQGKHYKCRLFAAQVLGTFPRWRGIGSDLQSTSLIHTLFDGGRTVRRGYRGIGIR